MSSKNENLVDDWECIDDSAEYAEARLRILGSAKSEEDEETNSTALDKNGTLGVTEAPNMGYTNRSNQMNSVGNSTRVNLRNSHSQQYQPYQTLHLQQPQQPSFHVAPEMRRIDDNVIRLPRGPDGTSGFMLKR